MKQGSAVHKTLEEEVHTTVPVEITTKEDGWALRIWNVIQGLRTLRQFGMTRELEVWGLVEGEIVTGVIDQLSYVCPDRELEESAAAYYENAQAAKAALPEYQMSITDYLLSPSRGGKRLTEFGWSGNANSAERQDDEKSVDEERPYLNIPRIYITDIKTRASRSIPTVSSSSFRPTHLQLQFYYHMLNRSVTSDDVTIEKIAQRYGLDSNRTFTDAFIAQVGGLNDQFFDAFSSSQASDPDYGPPGSQQSSSGLPPEASQDSTSILLAHNNLASLWALMKDQLRLTFLPSPNNAGISPSIPSRSQPAFLESYLTVLSPLLTARYLSSADTDSGMPDVLGSRSFLFDPAVLTSYVSDQMTWWRGERDPRGVEVMDAWKCRICEFREECSWRKGKERELATRRKKRGKKTAVELLEGTTV
jgi:exonuclease V